MARTVKPPDVRRSELIATAQHLFYTKGYETTSVSDIIDSVGVAKGTFYYYFDSKQAILEAIIDELMDQSMAILQKIVSDETLAAIPKWQQAFKVIGSWKVARREELIEMLRLIAMDENVLLQHKFKAQAVQVMSREIAKIILQGVEEGVFDTPYIQESAEIVLMITQSASEAMGELLLNSGSYEDPAALAQRKVSAIEAAIERVLNAPPGSLSLIDSQTLAAWFDDQA
jgi:AcrR family transcriptional regulator